MTTEDLFWHVVRNKVIFKYILNLLRFDVKQKFEHSTICRSSINWLILNGYRKTLKHKIINNDCHKLYLNTPYNGNNKLFTLLLSLKEFTNVELYKSIISIYPIHFELNLKNIIMASIISGNLTAIQIFSQHFNYHFDTHEFNYALTIGQFEISKFIIGQLKTNNNKNNMKSIEKEVWTRITKEFRVKDKFIVNLHEKKSDSQSKVDRIGSLNQFINYLFDKLSFTSPIKSGDYQKYSLICYNCPFELDVSVKWLLNSCYTIMYLGLLDPKKDSNCYLSKQTLYEMKFTDSELSNTLNQSQPSDGVLSNNIKKLIKCYLKVRLIVNDSHSLVYWLKYGDDETIQTFNQIKIDHGINDIMPFKYGDYKILDKWFKHLNQQCENGYSFETTTTPNTSSKSLFEFCHDDIEKQKLFIIDLCNDLNSKPIISSLVVSPISLFSMVLVNDNLELVKLTFTLLKDLLNVQVLQKPLFEAVYKYIKSPLVLEFIYNLQLECFKQPGYNFEEYYYSEWTLNGRIDLFETLESLNFKNGITGKVVFSFDNLFPKVPQQFTCHENYLKIVKYTISKYPNIYIDNHLFINYFISDSTTEQHEHQVKEIISTLSTSNINWYSPSLLIRPCTNGYFNECNINIIEWMIDNNKIDEFGFEIAYYVTGKLYYLFNDHSDISSFISKLDNWYDLATQCNDIKVILMILDKLMNQETIESSKIQQILNGLFENEYLDSLISIQEKYPQLFNQQHSIFDNDTIIQFIDLVIHNDNIDLIPFLNQCYPNILKQYQVRLIDHKTTCYAYIKKYIHTIDQNGFFL